MYRFAGLDTETQSHRVFVLENKNFSVPLCLCVGLCHVRLRISFRTAEFMLPPVMTHTTFLPRS
jgi:hypothetical protein